MDISSRVDNSHAISMTARLRLEFLVPLIGAIVVLLAIWMRILYVQHREAVAHEGREAEENIARVYRGNVAREAQLLSALMDTLQLDERLRAALAARDRPALLAAAAPLYARLRRDHGITHFYFSDPGRVILLRVHQPERQGDVITRHTTREAERTRNTASGMELGPFGTFTLRVVKPWIEGGTLLGYVELGIELDRMLRSEEMFEGVPLFPLIAKRYVDRARWEEGMRMLGRSAAWDQFQDVVLSSQVVEAMQPELRDALLGRLAGGLPASGDELEIAHEGAVYRAAFIPLVDADARNVGTLVALVNISESLVAARSASYAGATIGVGIAIGLAVFFHWLVGRLARRLERDERELKRLAVCDSLTGLENHGQFFTLLARELERGKRFRRPVSLLMLDIDEFKAVNDTYGHQAGDSVLARLATQIHSSLRSVDSACRYGGEEFSVILPETDVYGASEIAERLRAAIAATRFEAPDGLALPVTVSIGVATWPTHADGIDRLVSAADAALYRAKRGGRNRVVAADGH
ncbi:MAG: diguanylate cyclase [Gammaproteobacteria bacterium]|nr:diguanylate cyclase [Gammaproteobacteria bacterium]MBI5615617.1 diguanylate cyclase [Gammaproteobacteria bacterium]